MFTSGLVDELIVLALEMGQIGRGQHGAVVRNGSEQ
jgi:hypothetical protein